MTYPMMMLPIERRIFIIRGQRVMLDRDLSALYQVPTKVLNQAVKRNHERFPDGFMFRLTRNELRELVTNCDRFRVLKHSSTLPLAFTDYGVAMLSSVLRSQRAVKVNIDIIRVFIRLRDMVKNRKELSVKLDQLERKVKSHDGQIRAIFHTIRELAQLPRDTRPAIGFRS